MIKLFLTLTLVYLMVTAGVVAAQFTTPLVSCVNLGNITNGTVASSPAHTRGQLFDVDQDWEVTEVRIGLYRTGSVSQSFTPTIYHYTDDTPDITNRTLLWTGSAVAGADLTLVSDPNVEFAGSNLWESWAVTGVDFESGEIYGIHVTGSAASAEVAFWVQYVSPTSSCSDWGRFPTTGSYNSNDVRYGIVAYGSPALAIEPTPTPIYDAPAMIDGLVGGGSEEDIGVGLIGGGVGLVAVAIVGALVGTGALLLATGGVLALVLLVTLGVIPTWTLVVILPVLLVAAYIRYALGNSS